MRMTLMIDDQQLAAARELSGIEDTTALVSEALQALISHESGRRLAGLAASEPGLRRPPRRRPTSALDR
jgi:hypothetical protein